jgi:putative PIN family toxin of toxin-antitoxin system
MDTNVLFSALYSDKGPAGEILDYFINGKLNVVVSQQVLEELIRNIKVKLPQALPVFQSLLVNAPPMIIKNPSSMEIAEWGKVINFEDAGILASAVSVQADYLLTGDRHFFENPQIARKSGLRIVTPAQFLKRFKTS